MIQGFVGNAEAKCDSTAAPVLCLDWMILVLVPAWAPGGVSFYNKNKLASPLLLEADLTRPKRHAWRASIVLETTTGVNASERNIMRILRPMPYLVGILFISVCGFSTLAAIPPAMAASCPSGQSSWLVVRQSDNIQSLLNSDNWGGGTACETNNGGEANYTVSQSAGNYTGGVLSYPDINVGCQGGYCTAYSGLPASESSIEPEVTWSTTNSPQSGSSFDTGIDSWFASSGSEGSNPTPNGEVMVLINSSNFSGLGLPHSGRQVFIDGYRWYVSYSPSGSRGWPYTLFALAQGSVINSVHSLNMANFYGNAIANNNLGHGEYLTDIGAGNEIWANGVGLSTTSLLITGL
jgi:hypothetical protein